ncbi:MAG: hypothetical protein LBJ41_00130 [Treponema sp.]|jgi:hypothetical protein|nr:hypothetical protein [Treponema sp.]
MGEVVERIMLVNTYTEWGTVCWKNRQAVVGQKREDAHGNEWVRCVR